MESFIDYQNNEISHIKSRLDNLSNNLYLIVNLNKESKVNLIDKLRILNKELYNLENLVNEIVCDIYKNKSDIDISQKQKIDQIEKDNKLIYKLSPLILYHQLINQVDT